MKESFRHFKNNKKVDLIGLGNAIVDIIVNIEDEFLEINNLDKGSMNLINSDESQRLLENCKVIKQISGGSSANTVVCLAELGNDVQFIGRVKNDQFGNFFSSDIKKKVKLYLILHQLMKVLQQLIQLFLLHLMLKELCALI